MRDSNYKTYLLTILLLVLAASFVERSVWGLLLQDIKLDLGLSDTQLGFLTGIAFALFYAIVGIPIARWADRGNRVLIISLTAALGSIMVALCATAASFVQLLLIRVGVAVGESGCIPPSNSLIADYFTRAERPRAISTYMLGSSLSVVIGFFFGGWLNEYYGWRVTFMLLGLPGLAIAVLAWFSLREPRRGKLIRQANTRFGSPAPSLVQDSAVPSAQLSLKEVCVTLWANITFRHLLFCYSVLYFFSCGIWKWQPAFFVRSHGLQTGELGTWFAVIYGLGGLVGTYLGGELASRHAAHNERLQLKAMAIVYSGFGIISACVYLSPNYYLAFGLLGLAFVGMTTATGPLLAMIQTLVPPHMRAMSIAVIYLFANLIGMGLGPLAAGVLSDSFRPWVEEESLRYALLALCPGYLWGAWHLWKGSKTVSRDLAAAEAKAEGAVFEDCVDACNRHPGNATRPAPSA